MPKKNLTINDLASMMKRGFEKTDKTINDIVVMVKQGFEETEKAINNLAAMTKDEFDKVYERFDGVDHELKVLSQGHEDNTLRLDNVAYRFELKDLERKMDKRFIAVEKKVFKK